jgi:hypothetical protein
MANKLINLMINEISVVDDPANQEATISLWKRKQPAKDSDMQEKDNTAPKGAIKKALASLFKAVDALPDETEVQATEPDLTIEADKVDEPAPAEPTADELAAQAAEAELAKAFKKSAEGSMTEEHKAFYDTLQGADKAEFVGRDETGRQEYLLGKRAPDAEKVAMAAEIEKLKAEKAAAENQAQTGEFLAKVKADYNKVIGTDDEKAELLKFVETSISKSNTNMAALIGKIMKQAQANIAEATIEKGHADETAGDDIHASDETDPKVAYNQTLKNIIAKDKCTRAEAIKKLKSTPEGMEIFSKSLNPTK